MTMLIGLIMFAGALGAILGAELILRLHPRAQAEEWQRPSWWARPIAKTPAQREKLAVALTEAAPLTSAEEESADDREAASVSYGPALRVVARHRWRQSPSADGWVCSCGALIDDEVVTLLRHGSINDMRAGAELVRSEIKGVCAEMLIEVALAR